jgi:hypothetical protein
MDILNSLVNVMSKEEVRNFKLWINSTNASNERKDVMLFDYIRKSGDAYNESYIFKKLYSNQDKNSFYRLKNRLQEDLGYNLSLLHFNKHESNNLFLLISLHNIFVNRNQPNLASYYLKKAEKKAIQSENFEMLDIIYAGFVKLSSDLPDINPESYIERRKSNAEKLNKIRETDQTLAAVTYRLKLSQNYGKRDTGLLKLLDNTIKEFAKNEEIRSSRTFQLRVFKAVSQILIQNHNFSELEKFSLNTYNKFREEKWFDKSNHESKLQMLVYIINSTFKNRKYLESLDYAETLGQEMSGYGNQYYEKYLFFYYNSLVINYAQIDIVRGLKALDEMEREIKGKRNAYYEFFILLNKASLLFFQHKHNEAIRNLVRLYGNDHYKKADVEFKMKIAVAECIMQYESGDKAGTKKRVEQVRKQFKEILVTEHAKRERFVLDLIFNTEDNNGLKSDKKQLRLVEKFVNQRVKESIEDGEVLKYRVWLMLKLEKSKFS